jgi:hypothetical protein
MSSPNDLVNVAPRAGAIGGAGSPGGFGFGQLLTSAALNNAYALKQDFIGVSGTGPLIGQTSAQLITPDLGTPSNIVLTNATGYPATALAGLGAGVLAALTQPVTGNGAMVLATSPTLVTPNLGVPTSLDLTHATALPLLAITGLGANIATALATALNGTGAAVGTTNAALVTPNLGTPSAINLANATAVTQAPGDNTTKPATDAFVQAALATVGAQSYAFRNRIINGDFRVDQRRQGASVLQTGVYACDRWSFTVIGTGSKITTGRNLNGIAPPPGFMTYMGAQVTTAYAVTASDVIAFNHVIEGINIADLGWPQAAPQPVTLSFWVYSSLTGNFGATLKHGAGTYSYPFLFNIPAANVWTRITVTVPGPVAGPAWPTDVQAGMYLCFCLGGGANWTQPPNVWTVNNTVGANGQVQFIGTAGAVFYMTGVQMELAGVASPFERRFYDLELSLCQRYFQRWDYSSGNSGNGMALSGYSLTGGQAGIYLNIPFYKPMRAVPVCASTSTTFRFVTSGSIGNYAIAGLNALATGPLLVVSSAVVSSGAGPGWIDTLGIVTADADY